MISNAKENPDFSEGGEKAQLVYDKWCVGMKS